MQGLPNPPAIGSQALAPDSYAGKTVLVTGGGTGLGKAIAQEFSRCGARVAIMSRKPDHLAAGKEAIEALGMMPPQIAWLLFPLADEPTGGYRAILMQAGLIRVWEKLRKP